MCKHKAYFSVFEAVVGDVREWNELRLRHEKIRHNSEEDGIGIERRESIARMKIKEGN